jgi:hypothetical protein
MLTPVLIVRSTFVAHRAKRHPAVVSKFASAEPPRLARLPTAEPAR